MQNHSWNIAGYTHYHNSGDTASKKSGLFCEEIPTRKEMAIAFEPAGVPLCCHETVSWNSIVANRVSIFWELKSKIKLREKKSIACSLTSVKPAAKEHEMNNLKTENFIRVACYGIPHVTFAVWASSVHVRLIVTRNSPNSIPLTHIMPIHSAFSAEVWSSARMKHACTRHRCGRRDGLYSPAIASIYRLRSVPRRKRSPRGSVAHFPIHHFKCMTKFHITVISVFIRGGTYEYEVGTSLLTKRTGAPHSLGDHKDTVVLPTNNRPNGFRHVAPSFSKQFPLSPRSRWNSEMELQFHISTQLSCWE
jgi:hypothetical protein